jgi:hypothetical protein
MNRIPDVELVLREWLADDGDIAPDRVLEVVADRIARQPRRPASRLQRRPFMNTYAKLGAAAAAILIVGVVGWQLLPSLGGFGDQPTQAPSPSATPSPSVTPTSSPATPGAISLKPLPSTAPNLAIDVTLPADWGAYDSWLLLGPPPGIESVGEVKIAFIAAEGLHSDPCHWDHLGNGDPYQPGDLEVGPTVEDLASALAASDAYESTTPADVSLGGFAGKELDLELSPGIADCDVEGGEPRRFVFSGAESRGFTIMGEAARSQVSIVDVNGVRLIAVLMSYAGTSEADLTAAQAILDSLVIRP